MTEITESNVDIIDDAGNDSFLRDGIRVLRRTAWRWSD